MRAHKPDQRSWELSPCPDEDFESYYETLAFMLAALLIMLLEAIYLSGG